MAAKPKTNTKPHPAIKAVTFTPAENGPLASDTPPTPVATVVSLTTYAIAAVELPLDLIDEEEGFNPRTIDDDAPLSEADVELDESIRKHGLKQPILVRPKDAARFRVVMGARRRRSAIRVGLKTIAAVIQDLDDVAALDAAMIENLNREDMNPMDQARGYRRMIDQRRAADPTLSLKDAKEQVATVVGKTVRLIELRLQFFALPPAKQEALAKGEITGKEATEFLRKQPKLFDLTPRQWLVALEVFDAQETAPLPREFDYEQAYVACGEDAASDNDVKALNLKSMLSPVSAIMDDGCPTGLYRVRFYDHALEQLRLKFGEVADETRRLVALAHARAEVGPNALDPEGCQTPWLNGPFEPSAETLAEIAGRKAEEQARRDAEAQARIDEETAFAARIEAGQARLAKVEEIIAAKASDELWSLDLLHSILAEGGKPLPWWPSERGGIRAANCEPVLHDYPPEREPLPDVVARTKIMALAVNALAGLATPQAPPVPAEAAVEPILIDPANLADEPGAEDAPADESEDEDEPATEDAAPDPAFSPALLRLAGGRVDDPHA